MQNSRQGAEMSTTSQMDQFVEELDRRGAQAVAGILGFRGDHDDVELDENLLWAFESLSEADAAQALRRMAMVRR
jgi:hypothetical protein